MSSQRQSLPPATPPSLGKSGSAGRLSPASSVVSLSANGSTHLPLAAYINPRTPETSSRDGPVRLRGSTGSTQSGSTSPSDDALSLASCTNTTASINSAADVCLFAPASTEDAVHAVPSLLSQLMSGRTDEQVLAARKLRAYCRHSGRPVEAAISAAGGVHMLLIMLDSLDRGLKDVCTRLLTDLAGDDAIRAEILSAPGGTAKVIQLMYRGILDGQASAGRFLELLAGSRSEAVQAALCRGKVVKLLCKTLDSAPSLRARAAALSALQAFCRQDPSNLRKLVWSGGVVALVAVLQSANDAAAQVRQEQQGTALALLCAAAAAQQAEVASALATPAAVEAVAGCMGGPGQPLEHQADAADVLAAVAAVPVKRQGVQQALTDHALPRALEIVHEAAADVDTEGGTNTGAAGRWGGSNPAEASAAGRPGGQTAQRRRLWAAAAAIVAQLAAQDSECCHSLLFHAQLLGPAVRMLISGGRYAAAQRLLQATRGYAASLQPLN